MDDPCGNNDAGIISAAAGVEMTVTGCGDAQVRALCYDDNYGSTIRDLCPLSCGVESCQSTCIDQCNTCLSNEDSCLWNFDATQQQNYESFDCDAACWHTPFECATICEAMPVSLQQKHLFFTCYGGPFDQKSEVFHQVTEEACTTSDPPGVWASNTCGNWRNIHYTYGWDDCNEYTNNHIYEPCQCDADTGRRMLEEVPLPVIRSIEKLNPFTPSKRRTLSSNTETMTCTRRTSTTPQPTPSPVQPTVLYKVRTTMSVTGIDSSNFEAAKPSLKKVLSEQTNIAEANIELELSSSRRRFLTTANIIATFSTETQDAQSSLETTINNASFATDLNAAIVAESSSDSTLSGISVSSVSETEKFIQDLTSSDDDDNTTMYIIIALAVGIPVVILLIVILACPQFLGCGKKESGKSSLEMQSKQGEPSHGDLTGNNE